MRLSISACLLAAIVLLPSCYRPPSIEPGPIRPARGDNGAGASEARGCLARLWRGANARDLRAVLDAYDADSSTQRGARTRFEGSLALDSLRWEGRIAGIVFRGDTVEATAFESVSWRENERSQAYASWRTYKLRRSGDRVRILSDLQRDYARARFTDLSIDLHPEDGSMRGSARITLEIADPGEDNLLINLNRGLEVAGIADGNGGAVPFSRRADLITVGLPKAVQAGDSLTLAVDFAGSLFNETKELGYSQVAIAPPGSFASWVTNWYPHLAERGSKSRGRIRYSVPQGVAVASSGRPIPASEADGGGSTEKDGRSRQVFTVRQPLDFSFAAAPYFHKSREVGGIALGVYLLRGGDAKADLYLDSASKVLAFEKGLYGFYPFDAYSLVEVPAEEVGTLGGSSEQGMNLFPVGGLPDGSFPLPLISHEMGHSWWGNLVAGDGAVIDEGLAQTTAVLAVDAIDGTPAMRRFLRRGTPDYPQSAALYFSTDAGVPERDIPLATSAADAARTFALHDLADVKGHFVYEMLRETIGEEAFDRGLRAAVTQYAGKKIRLGDLRRIWEGTSGRDLGGFFREWFERGGAPEFRMTETIAPAAGGFDVIGKITQAGEPYTVDAEVVLANAGAPPRIEKVAVSGTETPFRIHVDRRPDAVLFDPDYKILRWTDSFRNLQLRVRAAALRECGKMSRAIALLKGCVARTPDDAEARCDLGICYEDAGELDLAEGLFRGIAERARIYDSDEPATTRSELHLGHLADLRRQRDAAKGFYAKALASTADPRVRKEAEACLSAPYEPKPPAAVDPAVAARCPGTYFSDPGITLVVAEDEDSLLTIGLPGQRPAHLAPTAGSAFRIVDAVEGTLEFTGGGPGGFSDLAVHVFGRDYHLRRQADRGAGDGRGAE